MRVFLAAALAAIVLAGATGVTLTSFNTNVADATATSAVRLNDQERANWFGRELIPEQVSPQT